MWSRLQRWAREARYRLALSHWSERDRAASVLLAEFVQPGTLVFDVGANYGIRVKQFLHLGARVVALEPQPECARFLNRAFDQKWPLEVVNRGLGSRAGRSILYTGSSHVLASLSPTWIAEVEKSGRFGDHRWSVGIEVELMTLDQAIQQFGLPAFVKIDVEGFEAEVLAGLSQPLPALSLEVMPEFLGHAFRCIDLLEQLAEYEYRLSPAESFVFSTDWQSETQIRHSCETLDAAPENFGDLYARRKTPSVPV